MAERTVTCLVIDCDDCGDECWESRDLDPHWTLGDGKYEHVDRAAVLEALRADWRWTITDDIELCPECVAKRACLQDGHQWTGWTASGNDRRLARWCEREGCGGFEMRDGAAA